MNTKAKSTERFPMVDPAFLQSMEWRCIGPHRGGRVVAVAGDPWDSNVFYFGACGGGVWKTADAGVYWENISDRFFTTGPVGAIAVSESDTNVIYVGTGESCPRPDVSHGDGVYKTTDGGKTWTHLGLAETRHIARIRIHPKNPDVVYVAAQGHLFGHNPERGVYRSTNGGQTWEHVLFKSEKAGAVDISMDPNNPRILYAAIFQFLREPWDEVSGGPDSGLYKSTDGGDTWTNLSNHPDLPQGIKGRIGVAVSPVKSGRVWALIEAEDGALFRTEDHGETWEQVTNKRDLRRSASSYHHVIADTQDVDTLYVLSYDFWKSTDGGRTFEILPMLHGDHHDLWIDPRNSNRMIEGNDGGATVTLNGGDSWSSIYNQPTGTFFHVTTDNQFPYRVYGTPQDNSAISTPSRSYEGSIPWKDSYTVGSAESGHIVVRPDDPNIVVAGAIGSSPGGGGNLLRYDHRTNQAQLITVWPEDQYGSPVKDVKYRFAFTYPVSRSPHDPDIIYVAANIVFRSLNEGMSWEAISPDLTRADTSKMMRISGGPITTGGLSSQYSSLIFAFVESPHEAGVFWAGTDDSQIHLSRDHGKTWDDVSPSGLPRWTCISIIEPSPHDPATVYVAAHRYKMDDHRPFLFKTTDYGETWKEITEGIPGDDFLRVIRSDQVRPGLLYAGSEKTVYVSFDDGSSWQSLQRNLPAVAVHDLVVKDNDLVAGTHGRAFWILDDLTPLHQITEQVARASSYLFKPGPTYRLLRPRRPSRARPGKNYERASGDVVTFYETRTADGEVRRTYLNAGTNPPDGVVVTYYLANEPDGEVSLTFLDPRGEMIKTFSSSAPTATGSRITAKIGTNRFVWDMRYPGARAIQQAAGLTELESPSPIAPIAPPGTYQVRLSVEGQVQTQTFEIRKDPRLSATQEDLDEQFALHIRIRDKFSETNDFISRIGKLRAQAKDWQNRVHGIPGASDVTEAVEKLEQKLVPIEGALVRIIGPNPMNLPPKGLNVRLAALTSVLVSADSLPTRQSYDVFNDLSARIDEQVGKLPQIIETDVADITRLVTRMNMPVIGE